MTKFITSIMLFLLSFAVCAQQTVAVKSGATPSKIKASGSLELIDKYDNFRNDNKRSFCELSLQNREDYKAAVKVVFKTKTIIGFDEENSVDEVEREGVLHPYDMRCNRTSTEQNCFINFDDGRLEIVFNKSNAPIMSQDNIKRVDFFPKQKIQKYEIGQGLVDYHYVCGGLHVTNYFEVEENKRGAMVYLEDNQ